MPDPLKQEASREEKCPPRERPVKEILADGSIKLMTQKEEREWRKQIRTKIK